MVREHPDPYLVLGVLPTATQAEISHAYRTGYAPITPTPATHRLKNRRRQPAASAGRLRPAARPRPPRRLRPRNHPRRHTTTPPPTRADTC